MKGVQFVGNERLVVKDFPTPRSEADMVVVEVRASAICGSDLHGYFSPAGSEFIPGHEISGEIVDVGSGGRMKCGDRVNLNPLVGCSVCKFCREGKWMFCDDLKILSGDINGGHAEFVKVPERCCFLLPDEISFDAGAIIGDIIGTQYHAMKRLGINATNTIGIFGLGPVGLGAILIAKFLGACVVAIDLSEYRCELAGKLGADLVLGTERDIDILEKIRDFTKGGLLDASFECAGSSDTVNLALDSVRKGGKVAFIGETARATINPGKQFLRKQLTVIGSWYYDAFEYEELISLIKRGVSPLEVVTHRFSLNQAQEAYVMFAKKLTGKVVLFP